MHKNHTKKILLTVDVEDWFQVENLRRWFPPEKWDQQEKRVEYNTYRLLDLFDSFEPKIKCTFFILGWTAKRFPELVRSIQSRGHEVASHGNDHQLNDHMTEEMLLQDLEHSKKKLEDISGTEILGYRAPNFSINDRVLELIKSCGYKYDSSYNSFDKHGRYGKISINRNRNRKKGIAINMGNNFFELPISNLRILRQTIPWGGGGYFRFFPIICFIQGIRQILKNEEAYLFYFHPWEIDPKQPRVNHARGLSVWRHYLNLDKTYDRMKILISSFKSYEFLTCRKYLKLP